MLQVLLRKGHGIVEIGLDLEYLPEIGIHTVQGVIGSRAPNKYHLHVYLYRFRFYRRGTVRHFPSGLVDLQPPASQGPLQEFPRSLVVQYVIGGYYQVPPIGLQYRTCLYAHVAGIFPLLDVPEEVGKGGVILLDDRSSLQPGPLDQDVHGILPRESIQRISRS